LGNVAATVVVVEVDVVVDDVVDVVVDDVVDVDVDGTAVDVVVDAGWVATAFAPEPSPHAVTAITNAAAHAKAVRRCATRTVCQWRSGLQPQMLPARWT
jgi:hypothetical protein